MKDNRDLRAKYNNIIHCHQNMFINLREDKLQTTKNYYLLLRIIGTAKIQITLSNN